MQRKDITTDPKGLETQLPQQKKPLRSPVQISLLVSMSGVLSLVLLALVAGAIYLTLPTSLDQLILTEAIEERSGWLNTVFLALTNTFTPANIVILSLVAGLAIWLLGKSKWQAFQMLASVAVSSVLAQLIKHLVGRSRPALSAQLVHETDLSFPSGHATGIVALSTSLALVILWRKGLRSRQALFEIGALGTFSLLICCSRVYVGAHWATDVCAGVLLGFGVTVIVFTALGAAASRFRSQSLES